MAEEEKAEKGEEQGAPGGKKSGFLKKFEEGYKKHWQLYSGLIGVAGLVIAYLIWKGGSSSSTTSSALPSTNPVDTSAFGNPADTAGLPTTGTGGTGGDTGGGGGGSPDTGSFFGGAYDSGYNYDGSSGGGSYGGGSGYGNVLTYSGPGSLAGSGFRSPTGVGPLGNQYYNPTQVPIVTAASPIQTVVRSPTPTYSAPVSTYSAPSAPIVTYAGAPAPTQSTLLTSGHVVLT